MTHFYPLGIGYPHNHGGQQLLRSPTWIFPRWSETKSFLPRSSKPELFESWERTWKNMINQMPQNSTSHLFFPCFWAEVQKSVISASLCVMTTWLPGVKRLWSMGFGDQSWWVIRHQLSLQFPKSVARLSFHLQRLYLLFWADGFIRFLSPLHICTNDMLLISANLLAICWPWWHLWQP